MDESSKNIKYAYTLNTDGACAGNPGSMGIGGVLRHNVTNEIIATFSEPSGYGTNNEAEYLAVIRGLELAKTYAPESLLVRADSQLIVYQITGTYSIRQNRLHALERSVAKIVKEIDCPVRFEWIRREQNSEADALASKSVGMPMAKVDNKGQVQHWRWDETFVPDDAKIAELPKLHAECQKGIERLHRLKEKVKFANFMELRTGGYDPYSRMETPKLQNVINVRFGESTWQWLTDTYGVEMSGYGLKVCRWVARGLRPDLAAKKASVDMEVESNILKNRTRR